MFNRMQSHSFLQDNPSFLIPNSQIDRMPLELRELCESYNSECREEKREEDAAAQSDWPVALFVPSSYVENYAYPLVIWFHDERSSEAELNLVMNAIGDQNYCGLAIRGNQNLQGPDEFGWSKTSLQFGSAPLHKLINITARRLRRAFHIHSERIFVAGSGSGADVALRLFAECPQWFAGAIAIDPKCNEELLLGDTSEMRGKNILQTVSRTASDEDLAANLETVRMFRTAGVQMDVRVMDEPLDPCSNSARFLDSWLISHLNCETYV
ncbi:MAG TPA: hypothetical protein DCG12_05745 [Planctomycetaceae bacterium]|nr:hypothetical protein [Planctomycetaceae bacterium]